MKNSVKAGLIKYGTAILFCGALVWVYVSLRDFSAAEPVEKYRMLSDAFMIPGMILIMAGLLLFVSGQGGMDGISYMAGRAIRSLVPGMDRVDEKFFDYVKRKQEKRVRGYGFLFAVGAASLAVAFIFLFLFYRLY